MTEYWNLLLVGGGSKRCRGSPAQVAGDRLSEHCSQIGQLEKTAAHGNRAAPETSSSKSLRLMEAVLLPTRQLEKSLRQMEDILSSEPQFEESLRHMRAGVIDWVGLWRSLSVGWWVY